MSKNPENMSQDELIVRFNNRYSKNKYRNWLQRIADKNQNLVKRFILNHEKNPYYRDGNGPITKYDNEYYALINWIIPVKSYNYREISWDEYCKNSVFRSSIIPVVKMGNVNYWLLGSFRDYENSKEPILSDFGGKCEEEDIYESKSGCPALTCARRELHEENKGLLTELVNTAINKGNLAIIQGKTYEDNVNFIFVELDYDEVKNIPREFKTVEWDGEELLGNLNFYKQSDLKTGRYRTSKNLTDLLQYLYRTKQ